jgi:hypothetical protein
MNGGQPKPWLSSVTSECPVRPPEQRWVESSFSWFADQFGTEVLRRDVVLPGAGSLTDAGYSGSPDQVEDLVGQVCELMDVDSRLVKLELFGFARAERGWSVRPSGELDDRALNAARHDGYHRLGYLKPAEFGYGLACYSWLRQEPEPGWASYVDPGSRLYLERGLAYLTRTSTEGALPTQLLEDKPITVGDRTIRISRARAIPVTHGQTGPAAFGLLLPGRAVRTGKVSGRSGQAGGRPSQPRREPPFS